MPRFVILCHDDPKGSHYDLMLEAGGVLKTWSLAQPPAANCQTPCRALPDHRLAYLDHEGPISGGRGSVTRWDWGTYETLEQSPTCWALELHGSKLTGRVTITQQSADTAARMLAFASSPDPSSKP